MLSEHLLAMKKAGNLPCFLPSPKDFSPEICKVWEEAEDRYIFM